MQNMLIVHSFPTKKKWQNIWNTSGKDLLRVVSTETTNHDELIKFFSAQKFVLINSIKNQNKINQHDKITNTSIQMTKMISMKIKQESSKHHSNQNNI